MTNLAKISLALIALLGFSLAAVFVLQVFKNRNDALRTELIKEQQQLEADRHYQREMDEKKETAAMKRGLNKMIGGKIESVDKEQGIFVLSVEAAENKQYTIHTDENTSIQVAYVDLYIWNDQTEGAEGEEGREKILAGDFASLKIGVNAQVEFAARMDVDEQQPLTAKKVTIAYYKEIEEP